MKKVKSTFYSNWDQEASAGMDYLHGSVADEECEAACFYEYARESKILRRTAVILAAFDRQKKTPRVKDKTKRTEAGFMESWLTPGTPMNAYENTAYSMKEEQGGDDWFDKYPWACIWQCRSFPAKPWQRLNKSERAEILQVFEPKKILPLRMYEAEQLEAMGIFDEFSAIGDEAQERKAHSSKHSKPTRKLYPLHYDNHWTHALFSIDCRKTKKRLRQEFEAWLELTENLERFATYQRDPTGKTGNAKDRLKDLAVCRLHREFGFSEMLKFTEKNRRRFDRPTKGRIKDGKCSKAIEFKAGDAMPFHDARSGQSERIPLNQVPLCNEESFVHKATARVREYLAKIIPSEFCA